LTIDVSSALHAADFLVPIVRHDVRSFFPRADWPQIYSTSPLERLNAAIKRRTNVVGIFPNEKFIVRLRDDARAER
jgi:putative transposase